MHHNDGIGSWVIHHPRKCENRGEHKGHPDNKDKAYNKVMSLTKVLQAIHDKSGETSSDDDE
jgi:hypothetical protein